MSTTATIEPRTKIVGANHTDVQISKNPWNEPRIVTGGATGGLFVRDTVKADGWGLVDAVAAGQVLASAGVNTVPVWTATPTLTSITVTTITTPGGGTIGSSSTPFASGTFSSYVAIGATPASAGAVRLANGTANGIMVRNAANTANLNVVCADTTNTLIVGDSGVTVRMYGGTVVYGSAALSGAPALRVSGIELQAVVADGSAYTTFRCADHLATNSFQTTSTTGFISLGTPAASVGAIRLMNHGVIYARNAANTADVHLLEVNTDNHVYIGQANSHLLPNNHNLQDVGLAQTWAFRTGYFATSVSTLKAGTTSVDPFDIMVGGGSVWRFQTSGNFVAVSDNAYDIGQSNLVRPRSIYVGTSISVGTNPSSVGALRLAHGSQVTGRNSANSGDYNIASWGAVGADNLILGTPVLPVSFYGNYAPPPSIAADGHWWIEATGVSPSRQLRIAVRDSGVTYYQNIGAAH